MGEFIRIFVLSAMFSCKKLLKFKSLALALVLFLGFWGLQSCENIYVQPEEDIDDAVDFAQSTGLLLSALEPIEHINSTYSFADFNRKNFDSLEQLLGCKLILIDSSTQDGDGMEYEIEYNGNMSKMDRKIRSGKIEVSINYSHREIGSVTEIKIDDKSPLSISNSTSFIGVVAGEFELQRNVGDRVDAVIKKMEFNLEDPIEDLDEEMTGSFAYSWISGESSQGLLYDQVKFVGQGTVEIDDNYYNFEITLPLEKSYELGCSDYILKGIVELKREKEQFKIDFDPFNNNACNDIIKIYKNGKEFEVRVP